VYSGHAADRELALIVMLLAATSITVLRNRFVNTFTGRFRGNALLSADSAEAFSHAAIRVE
jgi:hypothetical protein